MWRETRNKVTEKPSRYWIKVKNSRYGQLEGREELFEHTQRGFEAYIANRKD